MRDSAKRKKKPDEISCVQLTEGTKEKLSALGKKGSTFEGIILELIEPKPPHEEDESESEEDDEI